MRTFSENLEVNRLIKSIKMVKAIKHLVVTNQNKKNFDKLRAKWFDIKKKSLPANHPTLITSYNNIGVIHQATKDYPAALECYKQTLEIQQKTLPPHHPDLAAVYNNIGVATQSMKEHSKALEYYKKVFQPIIQIWLRLIIVWQLHTQI